MLTSLQREDFEQSSTVPLRQLPPRTLQVGAHAEEAQRAHQLPSHGELRHVLREGQLPCGPHGCSSQPGLPGGAPSHSDFPSPPHSLSYSCGNAPPQQLHNAGKGTFKSQYPGGLGRPDPRHAGQWELPGPRPSTWARMYLPAQSSREQWGQVLAALRRTPAEPHVPRHSLPAPNCR